MIPVFRSSSLLIVLSPVIRLALENAATFTELINPNPIATMHITASIIGTIFRLLTFMIILRIYFTNIYISFFSIFDRKIRYIFSNIADLLF